MIQSKFQGFLQPRSVRKRLLFSNVLAVVIALGLGALALSRLRSVGSVCDQFAGQSLSGIFRLNDLQACASRIYGLTARQAHQTDAADAPQNVDPIKEEIALLNQTSARYEATLQTPRQHRVFASIQAARDAYVAASLNFGLANSSTPGSKSKLFQTELEPAYLGFQQALEAASAAERFSAETARENIQVEIRHGIIGLGALLGGGVTLLILSGALSGRTITRPLVELTAGLADLRQGDFTRRLHLTQRDEFGQLAAGFNEMAESLNHLVKQVETSSRQVSTSVESIAATSKEQQATASQIASATTAIGSTSNQISVTSKELVKTMEEVSHGVGETAALASSSQAGLERMERTMKSVTAATGVVTAKLSVLTEKAGSINQVVATITKVADQTNLLSLNAAIEAEKAGELGRGFAVVATEIRRLADQTAEATYDIEQIVKEIHASVSAGVSGMGKFSEEVRRGAGDVQQVSRQLQELIARVQALRPRFEQVQAGMEAQATGAGQISQGLHILGNSAQQTVASLRNSSEIVTQLNAASEGLRSGVTRFKLQP